jgi:hypothetical protein
VQPRYSHYGYRYGCHRVNLARLHFDNGCDAGLASGHRALQGDSGSVIVSTELLHPSSHSVKSSYKRQTTTKMLGNRLVIGLDFGTTHTGIALVFIMTFLY